MFIPISERIPTRLLAGREWNEAQRSVVESFQKTTGVMDERVFYIVAAGAIIAFFWAAYSVIKRFLR